MLKVDTVLQHLHDSTTVRFAAGTYFFTRPIVLPGNLKSVTLAGDASGNVVLSGGHLITGWKRATLNGVDCWSADLPGVRLGLWDFRELWVNGKRAQRARFPATGYLASVEPTDEKTPWNQGQTWFGFKPGDLPDEVPQEAEAVVMNRWEESRMPIASVDAATHRIHSTRKSVFQLLDGDLYYLEGAGRWAKNSGDWYLDRRNGTLYYLPRAGEKLDQLSAIAPLRDQILRVNGATNLTLSNIIFANSEWNLPDVIPGQEAATGGFGQADVGVSCAVSLETCHDSLIRNCKFEHLGNYAIEFGKGCQQDVIDHCSFTDLGAGAIKIGEQEMRDDPSDQTFGNTVTDCSINDGGHLFPSACGIWVGQSYDNSIEHNEIADLYYTAISMGWTWGYGPSLSRGNRVEGNLIHHIGKKSDGDGPILSDMGGIYTLGARPGTVISGNIFHDVAGKVYGGWGIYLDEGSSGVVIEKNLVYRTTHGGFHLNYGKDNIVQNNIFAYGRDVQIARTRVDPGMDFTFKRNIVYWDSGVFTQTSHDAVQFDENLYRCFGDGKLRFGGDSWDQWKAAGEDTHSTFGDPGFTNPATGEFAMPPGSVPSGVGFDPVMLKDAGPRTK